MVVPVLNERANVAAVARQVGDALAGLDWELIFVDDDSADGTADAVRELAAADRRIRLVLRVADPGLSNSCIQGMLSSCADVLCVMDGDGQHDPANIPRMLDMLEREPADLVSACRDLRSDDVTRTLGGARGLMSRLGNLLVRLAIGRPARDALSGFFVIRREAFLGVVRRLSNSGFKLLFDMLASDRALRHAELPFEFRARLHGQSKLDARVLWQFALLLAEKLSGGWLPARLLSFLAVGSAGLVVHMAVLYGSLGMDMSFQHAQASAALVAITFNFVLNNQLTFADRRFRGWRLLPGWLAYLTVCSVGLAANVSVATWVHDELRLRAFFAALAGIAMDVMWKFVISDKVVWRRRARAK